MKKTSTKRLNISLIVCVADDLRIGNFLKSVKELCEIIVVLNGATSKVKKIVEGFDVKIIEIPDRNLSKARNIGILNSKYDKVVFYDSDCLMVDYSLEKYSKMLDEYLLVDGKVEFKSDTFSSKIISVIRSMGLPGYALCPSIGINKKILPKINNYYFDEDIKWIEDSELNIRAKKAGVLVGIIDSLTCIHDNITFKQDLKSAYRYGTGVKRAAKKGLHKKRPTANWMLIKPSFKNNIGSGFYCILWNIVYCIGYYVER